MNNFIESLAKINKESLTLEFKSEWYWTNKDTNLSKSWGELLKDFAALVNCSHENVSNDKYLIIGVREVNLGENEIKNYFLDTNGETIKKIRDLDKFRKEFQDKINTNFKKNNNEQCNYNNYEINEILINNKKVLVFKIGPTENLLILKNDLQDKKKPVQKNSVLIRSLKSKNDPEICVASPEEIQLLKDSIKKYSEIKTVERKKEVSVEKTINMFLKNNSSYALSSPIKINIKNEYIRCDIYPIKSDFVNIDFIYIYSSTSQQKTYDYIIKEKKIDHDSKKIILISEKIKKRNIERIFSTDKVFFIEEYGNKYLYNNYFDDSIFHKGGFNVKNYVESLTEESKEKSAYQLMHEWYDRESNPLIVIKGYGGVGKTTLVKHFLDDIEKEKKTNILFINSNEILNDIIRYPNINDVFQFYEALVTKKNIDKKFNKELLELSIDNGSLLIALDGIDEVITKAGAKFDVHKFISTIYETYSSGSDKTKIIITCRDYFWDSKIDSSKININTIELKPFDYELTEKFLKSNFKEKNKLFEKSIKLAKEFALSTSQQGSNENIYVPYILDLIVDIIKRDNEFDTNPIQVENELLSSKITNDYIIERICNREIKKLNNISTAEQINIFMYLALRHDGAVPIKNIKKLNSYMSDKSLELPSDKFQGHPILTINGELLEFRYDFYTEYFKSIYLTDFFIRASLGNIDNEIIEMLSENIRYDNDFTKNTCTRLTFDDSFEIFIIDLINYIDNDKKISAKNKLLSKSSILILLLVNLKNSKNQNNIQARTSIIENIFGEHTIDGLSIINLFNGEKTNHVNFDFKGKTLNNCHFENYEYFWDCSFDQNTKFINSVFLRLEPRPNGTKPSILPGMFGTNSGNDTTDIDHIISSDEKNKKEKGNKLKSHIKNIIEYFESGGTFQYRRISDLRRKYDTRTIDKLIQHKVIQEFIDPKKKSFGKQYRITEDYHGLIKVIEQGDLYIELERILHMLNIEN